MKIQILLVLALLCPALYAADAPPSDSSLKELLEVAQAHKTLDAIMCRWSGCKGYGGGNRVRKAEGRTKRQDAGIVGCPGKG